MDTKKLVVGVLAGVAVGALLGVLFAPDKGSETRKKIARKGEDTVDDIKDKFDDLLESLTERIEDIKDQTTQLCEKGKHKAEEFKKDVRKTPTKNVQLAALPRCWQEPARLPKRKSDAGYRENRARMSLEHPNRAAAEERRERLLLVPA